VGGDKRLYRREAGRLVGCGPLLFFDVATFYEGVVTLGEHRPALARCPPQHFPDYVQWQCEVAAVVRLSNPDSVAQQVLDSVRGYLRRSGVGFSTDSRT